MTHKSLYESNSMSNDQLKTRNFCDISLLENINVQTII